MLIVCLNTKKGTEKFWLQRASFLSELYLGKALFTIFPMKQQLPVASVTENCFGEIKKKTKPEHTPIKSTSSKYVNFSLKIFTKSLKITLTSRTQPKESVCLDIRK